ncbi:MAG: hypothetical protein R3D60_01015 [Paracoccaceae bacterium]
MQGFQGAMARIRGFWWVVLSVSLWAGAVSAEVDVAPREGRRNLAINLAAPAAWSTEMPFIDQMHTATRWLGHLPGEWGGFDEDQLRAGGYMDDDGWILSVPPNVTHISTMVLTDLPAEMTSAEGRYVMSWEGTAYVGVTGAAYNVRYGRNETRFDFRPGHGSVLVEFERGSVRNLRIIPERHRAAYEAGQIFNPDFVAHIADMENLRFMDWGLTNNSRIVNWADRPQLSDYTWEGDGIPFEVMIDLANLVGAEPWLNIPHLATDDFVRELATMVRGRLNPELRAWYEFSNEIWNWQFDQANWAEDNAQARWSRDWGWAQFGAIRAAEVMRVLDEVYGAETDRRVRVLGMFTGWLGLEDEMLEAPDFMRESPDHVKPAEFFDAIAVTGYFTGNLHDSEKWPMIAEWLAQSRALAESDADAQGLTGRQRTEFIEQRRFDLALDFAGAELYNGAISGNPENSVTDMVDRVFAYYASVAERYDLALVMYEGGTHLVVHPEDHDNQDLIDFFIALNYSPQMGDLYRFLIEGWNSLTPAPFNAYTDVVTPSIWGSWGHLRHLDDSNPRWDAMMQVTQR